MKKFLMLLLAVIIAASMSGTAFAAGFPDGHPDPENDYQLYEASDDTNTANVIPSWGYIGFDAEIIPDPDPETPPTVEPEDASEYINVEVPIQTMWAAFEGENGNIVSPSYTITNKDTKATLSVTVESYTQTNAVVVPSGLTLNLTGGLAKTNIVGLSGNTTAATTSFAPGNVLTFGFGGSYTGAYSSSALQPSYDMVLRFAVLEIAA